MTDAAILQSSQQLLVTACAALVGWADRVVAYVREQLHAQDAKLASLEAEAAQEPVPSPAQRGSAGAAPGSSGQKPRKRAPPLLHAHAKTVCPSGIPSCLACTSTAAGHPGPIHYGVAVWGACYECYVRHLYRCG